MTRMLYCTRLRSSGKQALYRADEADFRPGETVIAESDTGLDAGTILYRKEGDETSGELPAIKRKAGESDIRQLDENLKTEAEGRVFCIDRIRTRQLPMKLVSTALTFDRKKFCFYFTAEKRVDFRELVKDLASRFRTRIELRQIGIRDEAKLVGGIGSCGREVCCKLFLTQFAPISIKMAKGQDIALNPTKISGLCGRLMCCLNYEHTEGRRRGRKKETPPELEAPVVEDVLEEAAVLETLAAEPEETVVAEVSEESEPAPEPVSTEAPAQEKPAGEQPERKGRRSKRRRGRRGQGQKGQTEQKTSGAEAAAKPADVSSEARTPETRQPQAQQPDGKKKSRRRRRRKPKQEQQ